MSDELPPIGMELGRAPEKPVFDPHAGREIDPGREFDGGEPMISTLVFIGVDHGGDFEDRVQALVSAADGMDLHYVTATVGPYDLDTQVDVISEIAEEIEPDEDEEENG